MNKRWLAIWWAAAAIAAGCMSDEAVEAVPDEGAERPAAAPDGTTGTVRLARPDGATAEVTYVVQNGRMMWEEDIDLGPAPAAGYRSLAVAALGKRWPKAQVNFVIDPSVSGYRTAIEAAIRDYEQHTPIDFEEGQVSGRYYLKYTSTSGVSNSAIGWQTPPSGDPWRAGTVFLATGMSDPALTQIITHETGHALGLIHEQNREDRGSFVSYDSTCVQSGQTGNFTIVQWAPTGTGVGFGDYDIESIMHYGSWSLCDNSAPSPASPPPPSWATRKNCTCYPLWKKGVSRSDPAGMIIPSLTLTAEDINTLWHMYEPTLGDNEDDDEFGSALAAADFDDDGYVDLAVGAKREAPDDEVRSGVVSLYKGTRTGLVAWTWFTSRSIDDPVAGDRFGAALAAGDLDDDGYPDLVVGAPRRFDNEAGAVYFFRGGPDGLDGVVRVAQGDLGGDGESDDHFGSALAIGDFDGDGQNDLAIGAPEKRPFSEPASGFVYVATWNHAIDDFERFDWVMPSDAGGDNATGTEFGAALATGDFNHDHKDDLVVGAPESNVGSGAAYVFLGGAGGLTGHQQLWVSTTSVWDRFGAALAVGAFSGSTWGSGNPTVQLAVGAPDRGNPFIQQGWVYTYKPQFVSGSYVGLQAWRDFGQSGAGMSDDPYDHFGSVLAAGNFNDGDSFDDLLIGVPDATYSGANDSGAVMIAFGSSSGVTGAGTHWWQPASYDNAAGDRFGAALAVGDFSGNGKLDFCAGAPFERNGSDPSAGALYLYTGRATGWPAFYSFHDQESGAFQ